jgi:lysozyme family protein
MNITQLKQANAARWAAMRVKADKIAAFDKTAARLCAPGPKARFQAVSTALKAAGYSEVPWFVIAVIAEREYGGPPIWDKQLGQGDPLHQVSTHDPAGRGPFLDHPTDVTPTNDAWFRCAMDALIDCAPHTARWTDWTSGGTLTILECYNGLGYSEMGVPSAYVWSGTDQYVSGKYVADHVYRASAIDVQEGCAPILSRMMAIDPSIVFDGAPAIAIPPSVSAKAAVEASKPVVTAPVGVVVQPFWLRAIKELVKPIGGAH